MNDLRHAPPPKRLGSAKSLAVPINIGRVSAKLVFDARSHRATGDATLDFHHGIDHGYPIFDLRQPITAAWLDGAPLAPAAMPLHRFGVKAEQSLRVLARNLRSGDRHRLRLAYDIAVSPLAASGAGGYQPALLWSGDGSVNFNFGFTDLGGGRYLEAWAPANLIYDRFALRLDVGVRNSKVPHALVTNGEAVEVARNHWRVRYPAGFTALSPMLQLYPQAEVDQAIRAVNLPVSG